MADHRITGSGEISSGNSTAVLNGSFSYKFGYVASGTIISIIPVLIVFMMFQKNYIEAVSGAVKG